MHIPSAIPILLGVLVGVAGCGVASASTPEEQPAEQTSDDDAAAATQVSDGDARTDIETPMPAAEPLLFFCRFFTKLDPATFQEIVGDLPEEQYQAALAERLRSEVEKQQIEGFEGFWERYSGLTPEQRQPWIEAAIAHHGLERECAVFLADAPEQP